MPCDVKGHESNCYWRFRLRTSRELFERHTTFFLPKTSYLFTVYSRKIWVHTCFNSNAVGRVFLAMSLLIYIRTDRTFFSSWSMLTKTRTKTKWRRNKQSKMILRNGRNEVSDSARVFVCSFFVCHNLWSTVTSSCSMFIF